MPTSATDTYTMDEVAPKFDAANQVALGIRLKPSTTFLKGQVLAEINASGYYDKWVHGTATIGTAGKEVAVLAYGCTTDASGNISTMGQTSTTRKDAKAWFTGIFDITELAVTGSDTLANLLADNVAWHAIQGVDLTAGLLQIG